MQNDPAFLFYPSDFLMGCSDLTMTERGQYITLLCIQHQKGFLTKKSVGLILGFEWETVSVDIRNKFTENENGEIYNERLKSEIEKRRKFAEKQRENGKKGGRPKKEAVLPEEKLPELKTQKEPKNNPNESLLENVNRNENKEENINDSKGENLEIIDITENLETKILSASEAEEIIEIEKAKKIKLFVNPDLIIPEEFKILWADWIEYKKKKEKKFQVC